MPRSPIEKSPVSVEFWRQCLCLHEKSWIYIYIYYIYICILYYIHIYRCGIPLHSVHKTCQTSTSRKRYGLVHCKNSKWLYAHSSLTLSCFVEMTLSNWLNRESHTRYSTCRQPSEVVELKLKLFCKLASDHDVACFSSCYVSRSSPSTISRASILKIPSGELTY